ncbi:MAG TPA: amino acid permease [Kofleriaceae bacterium]|nr:amino acid permease [Kofleriaceae bacterium]
MADHDLRRIGLVAATAIVVANMIGTGVFTTTGFMASDLGDAGAILAGWVAGGLLALCGAAAYAELGGIWPRVGGEYVYLRESYSPVVGFLAGWVSLIAGFAAPVASAALAFDRYLGTLVDVPHKVPALIIIAGTAALHGSSVLVGARVQTVFTVLKVTLIVALIGAGLTVGDGDWSHFDSRRGGMGSVLSGTFANSLVWVTFAYSGWNAAAYIAGEIKDPARNLPRALLLGTGIVTLLYVGLNVVYFYALPPEVLAPPGQMPVVEVGDATARALFGTGAGRLISTLISLALVSSVSAMAMAGPRVYAAMAEDRVFPPPFARRNARGAPAFGVFFQALLAMAMVLFVPLGNLILYTGFTLSAFAALTVAAVFVMRARDPAAPRPYRTFGYPVTPALFILLSAWMSYYFLDKHPRETFASLATLVTGLIIYVWARTVDLERRLAELEKDK